MARKFNKTITTPEQKEIYDKLTKCLQAIADAEVEERNAFGEWAKIEGKYSTGKTYSAPQQGCRGYDYEYANPEDKQKEIEEMNKYRNEVLIPLREKIAELKQESYNLDNQLCIALWGFDEDTYNLKRSIERKRKYIKELYEEIEEEKKKLEKMEKKFAERG